MSGSNNIERYQLPSAFALQAGPCFYSPGILVKENVSDWKKGFYYRGLKVKLWAQTSGAATEIWVSNGSEIKPVASDVVLIIPKFLSSSSGQRGPYDFFAVAKQALESTIPNPYFRLVDGKTVEKIRPGSAVDLVNPYGPSWSSAAGGEEVYYIPSLPEVLKEMDSCQDGDPVQAEYSILFGEGKFRRG